MFDFKKLTYKLKETLDWQSIEEVNEDLEISMFESFSLDDEFIQKEKEKWVLTNK